MAFKNALEEVRFSSDVEHNPELISYFDEAIDKAEKNESVLTISSKLNYQLTTYIQTHHFKAPEVVSDFMHECKRQYYVVNGFCSCILGNDSLIRQK